MQTRHSNAGALFGGVLLIAFGLLALVGQIFRTLNWGVLWPFTIIGFGMLFFVAMFTGGKQTAAFAIPGSIVSGIGLVLLFQSITHHWESMSYFWTFIVLFIGLGLYIMGWQAGDEDQKRSGARVVRVGLILFVIFGAFFEMLFSSFSNLVFPVLLILLGAYLIVSRSGLLGGKKDDHSVDSIPPVS